MSPLIRSTVCAFALATSLFGISTAHADIARDLSRNIQIKQVLESATKRGLGISFAVAEIIRIRPEAANQAMSAASALAPGKTAEITTAAISSKLESNIAKTSNSLNFEPSYIHHELESKHLYPVPDYTNERRYELEDSAALRALGASGATAAGETDSH